MRAIWKGAVAFGLVNVPVRLYSATGEHEVTLHQVHKEDGGRIRYRKFCSIDGEPVEMSDIAKGYETDDGELVVLTDEDFKSLPLSTEREIEVLEFVPVDQVDPILLQKTYYLEPEKTAAKPYALLRGALEQADRVAVVKVALRQRESMAILRVRDNVIVMQTLLWPDEVRAADFPVLDEDVSVRPQELAMAASLVDSLAADFDPSQYEDRYAGALEQLIEAKVSSGSTRAVPVPVGEEGAGDGGGDVVDLLAALQRSVEKARGARGEEPARRGGGQAEGQGEAEEEGRRGRADPAQDASQGVVSGSSADRQADAVAALRRIAFLLERAQASPYRSEAFRGAARSIERQAPDRLAALAASGSLADLPAVGARTADVVAHVLRGKPVEYLDELEREHTTTSLDPTAAALRERLRGDLHSHTEASDGKTPIQEMVLAALELGHEYLAITDHSPRLTVANGLSASRLRAQLDQVRALNGAVGPFRVLTGIEVRHPRRRRARPGPRPARPARRRGRVGPLEAPHGVGADDPPDDRRGEQPPHRRPRALHGPADQGQEPPAERVRRARGVRRLRGARCRGGDQLPPGPARPAARAARDRDRGRLRLLHRHGRPRTRPARLARRRLRAGRAARPGPRARDHDVAGGGPPGAHAQVTRHARCTDSCGCRVSVSRSSPLLAVLLRAPGNGPVVGLHVRVNTEEHIQ